MDIIEQHSTTPHRPSPNDRSPATRRAERGASLVEYALLVALIAVVMVGAVTFLGGTTSASIDGSGSSIIDATS